MLVEVTRAAAVDHVVCSAVVITGRAPFRQICCEVAHVVGLCAHALYLRGVRRGTPGTTPALAVVLLNLLCGLSRARLYASGAVKELGGFV